MKLRSNSVVLVLTATLSCASPTAAATSADGTVFGSTPEPSQHMPAASLVEDMDGPRRIVEAVLEERTGRSESSFTVLSDTTRENGMRMLSFTQTIDGVPLQDDSSIVLTTEGRIVSVHVVWAEDPAPLTVEEAFAIDLAESALAVELGVNEVLQTMVEKRLHYEMAESGRAVPYWHLTMDVASNLGDYLTREELEAIQAGNIDDELADKLRRAGAMNIQGRYQVRVNAADGTTQVFRPRFYQ